MMCEIAKADTPLIPYRSLKDTIVFENRPALFSNTIPGLRQKRVGMGLTIAGLGLFATSFSLIASGIFSSSNNSRNAGTRMVFGAVLLNPAVGLTVPGAILWGIGSRKNKRYRENYKPPPPVYYKNNDPESIPNQERF